jgi:hypothetical protein
MGRFASELILVEPQRHGGHKEARSFCCAKRAKGITGKKEGGKM